MDVISAEDFKKAIDHCCQDPMMNRYYANAPAGARVYIGLAFYATYFGEAANMSQYQECFNEILGDLKIRDLQYLLRYETDPDYRKILKGRLEDLKAAESPEDGLIRELPTMYRTQVGSDTIQANPQPGSRGSSQKHLTEYQLQLQAARRQRITHGVIRVAAVLVVLLALGIFWQLLRTKSPNLVGELQQTVAGALKDVVPSSSANPASSENEGDSVTRKAESENRFQRERVEQENRQKQERAEQEKRLDEQKAQTEAEREAREKISGIRKQYAEIKDAFRRATCDMWRNAPREDRPNGVKSQKIFYCLVPQNESYDIFRLQVAPGREMEVSHLYADAEPKAISVADFTKQAGRIPHLLMVEDRAYFSVPGSHAEQSFPVPVEDFSPFEKEFGSLYDIARNLGIRTPPLACEVFFRPRDGYQDVALGVVHYGHGLSRNQIFNKVGDSMAQLRAKRANRDKGRKTKKRTVVFGKGTVVRKRLDGVTEVPRNFIYTSSNRHRYYWDSHNYEDEVRKENMARAKWQELYDEAERQEKAEEEDARPVDPAQYRPSDSEIEEMLRSGSLYYRMKK